MDEDKLDPTESNRLAQLETVVQEGLTVFAGVIEALAEIWKGKLYREHGTFDQYCRTRWSFSANYAYRLFKALEVWSNLEGSEVVPLRETQVRPLVGLPEDKQRALWQEALAKHGPEVEQSQVQAIVDEDWLNAHAPFDIKEAVELGTLTMRQAIKLAQVLPRVNPAVAECVMTWGFGEHYVIQADAVIALDDIWRRNIELFSSIALSGHIQTNGDPIPLCEANVNDLVDALEHTRFEHRLAQKEVDWAVRDAELANALLTNKTAQCAVVNNLEDAAHMPPGDVVAWVWANGDPDMLSSLAQQGFRVVAAMVVRGDPAIVVDNGKVSLVSALNGRRPNWFDHVVRDSVSA